jgi:hypothetical protein
MSKTIKLNHETLTNLLDSLKDVQAERGDWRGTIVDAIETVEGWAEYTEEPERVVFRKFPSDGAVIALFPDQYNPRTGLIGSYMELGQHSDAQPHVGDTVPADVAEYSPLLGELKRQGYANLKVVKRLTIKK